MFATLPSGFPQLEAFISSRDAAVVSRPPQIESIGRRLRRSYERARESGYSKLSMGEVRKLPYAYWLRPERPLHQVEPDLVRQYWLEFLPAALGSSTRRAKRWLAPLFFAYIDGFDAKDQAFNQFAQRVVRALATADGAYAERLKHLQGDVAFFSPDRAPKRVGEALIGDPGRLDQALESYLLWPNFVNTAMGGVVFDAILGFGDRPLRDWDVVARVLDWAGRLGPNISQTHYRVRFADALLRPWKSTKPPDSMKNVLRDYFVKAYGDPRVQGHRQYHWNGVSEEAVSVLTTWLAGDTLRAFVRILERTADEIWKYRQKFWMAYYDAGYIQEAWLALGTQAARIAEQLQGEEGSLRFARLAGGATPTQSVLLLKIGHLVFIEWSHDGSLRANEEDSRNVPELYQARYHGADLRATDSMDFHDGTNLHPQLRHISSAGGSWQRKARDFIRRHTGTHLEDWKIV